MSRAKEIIKFVEREISGHTPVCPKCKVDAVKTKDGLTCPRCKEKVPVADFRKDKNEFDSRKVAYISWIKSSRGSYNSIARGASVEEVEKKAMDVLNSKDWKEFEKPPYSIRITHGANQKVVKEYEVGEFQKEAMEREWEVSLRSGDQNVNKTKKVYKTNSAADAAKKFMADFFPDEKLYLPLRSEQPEKGQDGPVVVYSAGTTASGQRVWVRGL